MSTGWRVEQARRVRMSTPRWLAKERRRGSWGRVVGPGGVGGERGLGKSMCRLWRGRPEARGRPGIGRTLCEDRHLQVMPRMLVPQASAVGSVSVPSAYGNARTYGTESGVAVLPVETVARSYVNQ